MRENNWASRNVGNRHRWQFFSFIRAVSVAGLFWSELWCIWTRTVCVKRTLLFLGGGRKLKNPEESQTECERAKRLGINSVTRWRAPRWVLRPQNYIKCQKYMLEWRLVLSIQGAELLTQHLNNERRGKDRLSCVLPLGACLMVFWLQQTVEGCLGYTSIGDLIKTT